MSRPDIVCLPNGTFVENCYLLADPDTAEAVVIDPGEESQLFLRRLETEGWTPRAIWLTHAHIDHIAGLADVVRATGAEVWLHPDDRPLYDNVGRQAEWLGVRVEQPGPPNHDIAAGDTMTIGRYGFEVRHVPGHSPGSVAFVGYGLAIAGDVLFSGSVGRVDLPGGNGATLLESIERELMSLPDDTVVYPGHGPETTVGRERATNPYVTGAYPLA